VINGAAKLLLSLSLSGSILAVLIFAMKPLIKHKLSKSIQYYIWIVVLLRLTLPFSFEVSIMNDLFYGNQTSVVATSQGEVQPTVGTGKAISNSGLLPHFQENVVNGDMQHGGYFQNLFNQYTLYIWMLGVTMTLTVNLIGYVRFLKYLKQSNISATNRENEMLVTLLKRRRKVQLFRNRFLSTPMLIGIARSCIIIPDNNFNEKQLKNILIHEIVHLKRFDITVKWLTMIASSIHWFNPLMYFIKKEINNSCELACDEVVIKNLSPAEKQDYGDTLISVVSRHKYPIGIFQCQQKINHIRLVCIMKQKKSVSISKFPIVSRDNVTFSNISKNALVLFCMIDNLDEVTFRFRDSQSDGKLDDLKYKSTYTFSRGSIEKKYGDLSVIAGRLDLLKKELTRE